LLWVFLFYGNESKGIDDLMALHQTSPLDPKVDPLIRAVHACRDHRWQADRDGQAGITFGRRAGRLIWRDWEGLREIGNPSRRASNVQEDEARLSKELIPARVGELSDKTVGAEFREVVAKRSEGVTRGGAAERFDDGGLDFGGRKGIASRDVCEAHKRTHEGELPRGDRALGLECAFPVAVIDGFRELSQLAAIDKGFEYILQGLSLIVEAPNGRVWKRSLDEVEPRAVLGSESKFQPVRGLVGEAPTPLARLQLVVTIQVEGTLRPSFPASDHAAYGQPS
jgi:hypothetical protein